MPFNFPKPPSPQHKETHIKKPSLVTAGRVFSLFRLFSYFLLRCNFVSGVDCHAHADQRATSEILVSLHQFLAACVEASCHTGKCTEWPIFMCFHFVCSPYLLSVFWAIPRFPFYSPAVLPFYYRVLPLRSRGIDPAVSQQRSSSGRNRKSSSSSHIHPNL